MCVSTTAWIIDRNHTITVNRTGFCSSQVDRLHIHRITRHTWALWFVPLVRDKHKFIWDLSATTCSNPKMAQLEKTLEILASLFKGSIVGQWWLVTACNPHCSTCISGCCILRRGGAHDYRNSHDERALQPTPEARTRWFGSDSFKNPAARKEAWTNCSFWGGIDSDFLSNQDRSVYHAAWAGNRKSRISE